MVRPIVVDLFFDGNPQTRAAQKYGYGTRTADQETFATVDDKGGMLTSALAGRPLSAALPSGTTGGKGKLSNMLLSPATEGGTPSGFHPNRMDDVIVVIDPQINGDSVRVPIGRLRADSIKQANLDAAATVPSDGTIERTRLRAAAAYHVLADEAAHPTVKEATVAPPEQQAMQQYVAQPQSPQPVMHQAAQPAAAAQAPAMQPRAVNTWGTSGSNPLNAFRQQPPAQIPSQSLTPHVVDTSFPRAASPNKHLTFAFELQSANGMYEMSQDAYYHDVLHIPGFVILVWDESYTDAKPYVPPHGEGAPPMAVQVDGDSKAYLVHATPINYSHRGFNYRVLIVDKVANTAA